MNPKSQKDHAMTIETRTALVERLLALSRKWSAEAHEIDQDGDFCCAQTRRHDAGELYSVARSAQAALESSPPSLPTAREVLNEWDRRLAEAPERTMTEHEMSFEVWLREAALSSQEPPSEGWEPTEQPVDRLGQGRLMLNAYGRRCWEAGRASTKPEPPSPPPALDGWQPIETAPAPVDGSVFRAYGPELVHPDFNPWGQVEACFSGKEFIGAVWDGQHDCWNTVPIPFTHWQPFPPSPERNPR